MINRAPRAGGKVPGHLPGGLDFAWLLVVAVACYEAGRVGLTLSHPHGVVTVWPAAGVAVAAVLLRGRWMLVGVAAGSLGAMLVGGAPVWGAGLAAAAWTLEPWLAVHLLERVDFRHSLRRPGDVMAFVGLAGVISAAVAAVVGAISLLAAGWVGSGDALGDAWRDWWLADMSGIVVVGSVVLVLSAVRWSALRSRATLEVLGMSAAVALLSYALLHQTGSLPYLVLPLMFMLAFFYGQRGAGVGIGVVYWILVLLTAHGHGPFSTDSGDVGLIRAEVFVCVGSATALLVAAAQGERRRAEQAADRLAVSEAVLAEAQQLAGLGSFYIDLVEGMTSWSPELFRILGRDPEAFQPSAAGWVSCSHPDDQPQLDQVMARVHAEEASASVEHRVVLADGDVRTVESHIRSEADVHGRPVRIVGSCQDITGRKQAEERFRHLFEDAPYPILVFDGAGHIQQANQRALTLFGYEQPELVGRPVEMLVPTPGPTASPWYRKPANDLFSTGGGEIELRGRRSDGRLFPIEVSLTPLVTDEGVLVSAAIRDVTKIVAAAETLSFQARHDSLTGLPNRMTFLERLDIALEHARGSGRPVGVIFLDLDNFKFVNDSRGHDAGDALLKELTPRLDAAVREGDMVGRLGGDEFVVLCENLPDENRAIEIAERLVRITDEPIVAAGAEHPVTLSAGVVIVRDATRATPLGVLRDADAAMYAAKERGKGRVAVFDDTMHRRLMERLAVEASLRGAHTRGELSLHYQPVVALENARVVAVEALLRWEHPARGLLAPAQFLPVAESTGLIEGIGEWVIGEACRQAARWRTMTGTGEPIPVSVNVSAHQLSSASLLGAVERALVDSQLAPDLLMLEVTEAALLADMSSARRELAHLKELGVRLIVDDFGAGYSSLPALRELMIDGLKLDRSFVQALEGEDENGEDGALVGAVLSMAHALDAQVTAEGVETWRQVSRLRDHGCDYGQGYLFARPRPAEDLTPMLLPAQEGEPRDEELVG
ncbi:MAG TPA: EAL domain-containing protein [Solirubrobacteraceae bacterium]|nr:EAL domain-containing protein [Solirubrobacteraceae bacterium]